MIIEGTGPPTAAEYRRASQKLLGTTKYVSNVPPHPRLGRATPWGGKVERGAIITLGDQIVPTDTRGIFYFHFNPENITMDYAAVNYDGLWQEAAGPGVPLPGSLSMNFAVLLNRQYDVLNGRVRGGTMHDINVLMKVVGDGNVLLQNKIVKVVFGRRTVIEGHITSLNVQHHQFTRQMVPVWTTVSISLVNEQAITTNQGVTSPPSSPTNTNTRDPSSPSYIPKQYIGNLYGQVPGGGYRP